MRQLERFACASVWGLLPVLAACGGANPFGIAEVPDQTPVCDLDPAYLADGGVGRDGIPALTDPALVPISPVVPANAFVRDSDRIIAVQVGAEWVVVPHNIMWRHEIVNFGSADGSGTVDGPAGLGRLAVTYCPLTGSALAFQRDAAGGAELRVSGFLYQANLIMYDDAAGGESFWPQMLGEARCGPRSGTRLTRLPVVEMTMAGWRSLHPESRMVGAPGGFDDWRLYVRSPYGSDYEERHNADFLGFPLPLDDRLPPKERVLGVPADPASGEQPRAFSFGALSALGAHAAVEFEHGGVAAVVVWDRDRAAAMAYRAAIGGRAATFTAAPDGVVDSLTGTTWAVDGTPVAGPLAGTGRRLRPIADVYVAFWAAWAAFHPGTAVYGGGAP